MLNSIKSRAKNYLLKKWGLENSQKYGKTSYSQEGEDILLKRILMDTFTIRGTYVDVGCNHPYKMSNTALFYDRGWRGVVIDPNPDFASEFLRLRPEDTFVNCGIGEEEGESIYYQFSQSLFNTFSKEKAEKVSNGASELIKENKVPIRRLDDVLVEAWPQGKKIHFLSIDCEGYDDQVIATHDFKSFPCDFVCFEVGEFGLKGVLNGPGVTILERAGFIPLSKLGKSVLWVHGDYAAGLGF